MGIFPNFRGENKKCLKPPPSLVLCVDSGAHFWLPSDNSKAEDGKNDRQGTHSESIAFADGGWCQHGRG